MEPQLLADLWRVLTLDNEYDTKADGFSDSSMDDGPNVPEPLAHYGAMRDDMEQAPKHYPGMV